MPSETVPTKVTEPAKSEDALRTPIRPVVKLYSGTELDEAAAGAIAAANPCRLIVIAGAVDCGKTTLICSLYELFQGKPVASLMFGGSKTLPAFERRCHRARIACAAEQPDTQRTPVGEASYLHLRVRSAADTQVRLDLLFTDVSGEAFTLARDNTEDCKRLGFIRRADHFVLLIDGERFFRAGKPWRVANDGMALLQSCLDSGMLGKNSFVNVIWSKFDYFAAAGNKEECTLLLQEVQRDFETRFASRLGRLKFGEIAARPTASDELKFGHGLPALLEEWVGSSPRQRAMALLPTGVGSREVDAFGERHFQGLEVPR